jgi:hypothetical protein
MSIRVSGELILRVFRGVVVMGVVTLTVQGCMARYALDRRSVKQISEAERKSRGRVAFERARERVREVRPGMSPGEVQLALGAVIAVEERPEGEEGGQRKLMDGFLCKVSPIPLRERWMFGYDEGNVQLVGFAVEFERHDADDDDWVVRRVDYSPEDDCPAGGDTHVD